MPRGNVYVDSNEIDHVAAQLNNAVANINPRLDALNASVHELLDNGLVLSQTSPLLQKSYADFTKSLTEAVRQITEFANQFGTMKTQAIDLDTAMARQLDSSH